jgi:hypothetical protein
VVVGSIPTTPIEIDIFGPVVQSVRTLACQARGREFEPRPVRHFQARSNAGFFVGSYTFGVNTTINHYGIFEKYTTQR